MKFLRSMMSEDLIRKHALSAATRQRSLASTGKRTILEVSDADIYYSAPSEEHNALVIELAAAQDVLRREQQEELNASPVLTTYSKLIHWHLNGT